MSKRTLIWALMSTLAFMELDAQVKIDHSIILNGQNNSDRQVEGLGPPLNETALLNVEQLRNNGARYAVANGTDLLDVEITPFPSSISLGTAVFIGISNDNSAPVSITINGIGPFPVKKNVDQDLDPADLRSGEIAYLIFDGLAFQLINARDLSKRDCPFGFVEVNDQYCIEVNERDSVDFFEAATICGDLGGRLCSWAEWHWACRDTSVILNDINGNWEWTNSTANSDNNVRVVGPASCFHIGVGVAQPAPARFFRCCYTR